jgi:hypothetical protein
VVDEEATAKKGEAEAKKAAEEGREAGAVEPVMKTTYEDLWDWRVENENKPIWTRNPKEVWRRGWRWLRPGPAHPTSRPRPPPAARRPP